jgi:AcrR family transcriptional regulator
MREDKSKPSPRKGGRPSKEQAEKLEDTILDAAAALFFSEGYGAASIEAIARKARISKRTFYARFEDKAAVFRAVMRRVVARLRPSSADTDKLFEGKNAEEVLRRIAPIILRASLSPEALSLQRVMMAEAARFPELARIVSEQDARQEAIRRIAEILKKEAGKEKHAETWYAFAAGQFLHMMTVEPQRRALGFGAPLSGEGLDAWANDTVDLFLRGIV